MRYVTFQYGARTSAGLVRGQFVYDLGQAFFKHYRRPYKFNDLLDFLKADGPARAPQIEFNTLHDDRQVCLPLRNVRLKAPIRRPPKIVCVGLNYRDHALEQKKEPPPAPLFFAKAPTAVIGDGDPIRIPDRISTRIDHEVELAVVIGRDGRDIPRDRALDHVFGYTIINDVTARDLQMSDKQWFRAKSFDSFAPLGPAVLTPDEFSLETAVLTLRVNGEPRQQGPAFGMVFGVPELIEHASSFCTLEAGDIIATGTPAGVGAFQDPPVFLKPGDQVEAEITGIGSLTNPVE